MSPLGIIKAFLMHALIPIHINPGGVNVSSCLILGGFGLWAFSSVLSQVGLGSVDPFVVEIGKAAFYTGLGSAAQKTSISVNQKP